MGRNSKSRKVVTRLESGTCNVCAAPCSSCLHIDKALATVKPEESSGETSQGKIGSQNSGTDTPARLSACDRGQSAASDSNCDIFHRDGDSNACFKSHDVSRVNDKVEMSLTTSPGRNIQQLYNKKAVKGMSEERKGTTGHEDSTSCVTGGGEANRLADSNKSVELCPDELSSPKKELTENSCSEEKEGGRLAQLPKCVESLSVDAHSKDLKENLGSKEFVSFSMKGSAFGEEAIDHSIQDKGHFVALKETCLKTKEETDTSNSVALEKASLKFESETQVKTVTENQLEKIDSSLVHNENEKVELCELVDLQEPLLDAGESDDLEHDVKVCDICGDAGREDLLAICSRCSDGAEHTYCMWKMIDKVPEGDWFCEECKSLDEIKLKDAVVDVAVSDKDQSSEVDSIEDTDLILDAERRNLNARGTKAKNSLGKRDIDQRPAEDVETPRVAKKQAFGSTSESLKSPRRVESLSGDTSFKKLNKGTLSKSSSFSVNPKAKVEFFSEVSQRKKSAREPAYVDREGTSKFIGRSASFKPSNLSRLSHSESNAKNLSPKFSHPQDVKGLRQGRTQNIVERKSSFKHDRLLVNKTISSSTVSTLNDQKLTPTDPLVNNSSEPKGVPSDSKHNKLSKSTSYTARKGEMNISSVSEQKRKDAGIKNHSSSSYYAAEKRLANSKGDLPGVLSRSQDTVPGERMKESSVVRSRTKIDSPRNMVNDASAARSSADVIKGNKLKAAIEAAMLKKPGICRKNKPAHQADEVAMPSTNLTCETRPEDHFLASNESTNISSAHEIHEEQAKSNYGDQSSPSPLDASLKSGDSCSTVPSGVSNQLSAMMSGPWQMPRVLPDCEYIWQGGFDIRKIGKPADLRDGLQAHLSTFVSPNVPEVANKFPSKLLLNEVLRLSTWPVQFHEAGAKEENIALYFFAKDLESYERSYKVLVETMMHRDLCLKGHFHGVDLLIFPSNHLPQNAQRWNTMYFLWGVFRRKKLRCVQSVSNSNACNASEVPECLATMNLHGISRNIDGDNNHSASLVLESRRSENVGEYNTLVFSANSNCQYLQKNMKRQGDAKRCTAPETNGTSITWEENVDPEIKTRPDVVNVQPSVHDSKTNPISNAQNPSSSKTSPRASLSNDLMTLERTVKEEEEPMATSSVRAGNMMVDRATEERNEMQFSHGKRRHEGPTLESLGDSMGSSLASTFCSQGESANKKQKTVPNCGHALEEETKAPKRGIALDLNETQDCTPDSPSPEDKGGGLFDLNVAQYFPPDKDDEEGGSSPLSLSLAFPSFNKEPEAKLKLKKEPVFLGRPDTRSSTLSLDGLLKK